MSFVTSLLNKLRGLRHSFNIGPRNKLYFGAIYKTPLYQNHKQDPSPLFFCMYSGPMSFVKKRGHYTDGININYLNDSDKLWLARTLYLIKKSNQNLNGAHFYRLLKTQRPSIVNTAYRRYHTGLINKPMMVSAGLTPFRNQEYPFSDPWVMLLNNQLNEEMQYMRSIEVSYSENELAERITNTHQQSIHSITQNANQSQIRNPQGLAPWARKI